MLVNDEDETKLQIKNVFGIIEDGQPIVKENNFDNIVGFNVNQKSQIFPRKDEVYEILC